MLLESSLDGLDAMLVIKRFQNLYLDGLSKTGCLSLMGISRVTDGGVAVCNDLELPANN